jgi:hypothetical protein
MCLNCGCNQPNERHGNDANITADDVRRAGEANGQDLATSAANMRTALGAVAAGNGTTDRRATALDAAAHAPSVASTTRTPR